MTFTAKHFKKIADLVAGLPVAETLPKQHQGKLTYLSIHYWVFLHLLCVMFQEDNPQFNRRQFIQACGSPYFDDVLMGVPVEFRECRECGKTFSAPLQDHMDKLCTKCDRLWKGDR